MGSKTSSTPEPTESHPPRGATSAVEPSLEAGHHDFEAQKRIHQKIRNDPDYDDWEYGTEPLPHEAWIAGRGGAGAPPAGGEVPQSITEETTPGG